MITRDEAIALVHQYIEDELLDMAWFKHIEPHIKAVLLYGSVAKNTNNESSDIDVLVIVPLAIEEQYTDGEYLYNYKGQIINIVLRSIEKLRIIAQAGNDSYQKEVFRGCSIITDNDEEVRDLLYKIAGK